MRINIELQTQQKDTLVLMAASRHAIVHNSSKVDRKFLNQVRDTSFASTYSLKDTLNIDDDVVQASKDSILEYADQLTAAIINHPSV
jgi:hypothetical protein